jgi:hypothetical protein
MSYYDLWYGKQKNGNAEGRKKFLKSILNFYFSFDLTSLTLVTTFDLTYLTLVTTLAMVLTAIKAKPR